MPSSYMRTPLLLPPGTPCFMPRHPTRPSLPLPLPLMASYLRKFVLQNFLPLAFASALAAALVWPDPGRALVELRVLDGVRIAQASQKGERGGAGWALSTPKRCHGSERTRTGAHRRRQRGWIKGMSARGTGGQGLGARGRMHRGASTGTGIQGGVGGCAGAGEQATGT